MLSCGKVDKVDKIFMNWSKFDLDLPSGIEVYLGINSEIPLKAWVAKVDLSDERFFVKVISSNDKDRLSTPSQFYEETNAKIIINGGYFNSEKNPTEHIGLLKTNGRLEEPASHSIFRESERYYISRGAFGVAYDGKVDIAWCSTRKDSIFEWDRPITNRPDIQMRVFLFSLQIIGLFKMLCMQVQSSFQIFEINLNIEDEVFFNTNISGVQPRSAIGYTKDQQQFYGSQD